MRREDRRLPTRAKPTYMLPAVGSTVRAPRGDEPLDGDGWLVNIWQAEFPTRNTSDRVFLTAAPMRTSGPTGSICGK